MALKAEVRKVTTVTGPTCVDIVKLVIDDMAYFIETKVGQCKEGQKADVEAVHVTRNGEPAHLRLVN